MIPAEAVEAAAKMSQALHFAEPWESLSDFLRNERLREAELILEAAAPYMLSHEREQTRLAHLDAIVNRETKREELAEAWEEGHDAGFTYGAFQGRVQESPNPYMRDTEGEK